MPVYQRKDSRYVVAMSDSDFFRQKVFNFKLEPDNTVCADCGKDGKDYVHACRSVIIDLQCTSWPFGS